MKRRMFLMSAVAGCALCPAFLRAEGKPEGEPRRKSGVIEGVISEKGENWIRVKPAEGESMRFMPRWIGGMPADGGGLDEDMLRVFQGLKAGDKVRVRWEFEERPRALEVTRLDAKGGEAKEVRKAE